MRLRPIKAATTLVVACAIGTLHAQVTVNGTAGSAVLNSNATNPGTTSYTYNLLNSTSKVLVAGYYNDNGTAVAGMTFGGVAATKFASNVRMAIGSYILPDPAPASVTITATLAGAGAPAAGFFVYELGGVDTSGGAAAIDAGTGASITTSGAEKFVISLKGINNSTGAGTAPAAGSIIPIANSAVFDLNGGIGGGAIARGYNSSSGPAGTKTLGWTAGDAGEVSMAFVQLGDPDLDDDGLTDAWELGWAAITTLTQLDGTNMTPSGSGDGSGDWDGDGFSDFAEFNGGVNSSDPTNPASVPGDTDGDTLLDADELTYFGNLSQTPTGDYDGDYASNAVEIAAGTSPTNASVWPDTEPDGMCDAWEASNGLNVGTDDSLDHADADGFANIEEFQAGTDPQDSDWSPENAAMAHRWSFTGDLADSVGGSDAQVANDTPLNAGSSSIQNPTNFRLYGGTKATSDYLVLGDGILSNLQSDGVVPVTIELWATQNAIQNWSRIFAFGVNDGTNPGPNEALRMTWTQGTDINADQVSWEPTTSWGPGNAPFVLGAPCHVVMTIVPAVFTNGAITSGTQVTWYASPASGSQAAGHPLYGANGSFNTPAGVDLRALFDSACTLGRSFYGDNTAAATYDEVRIWKGALTESERELFQLLGPDNFDRSDVDNGGLGDGFPDQWEIAYFGNTTTAAFGSDSDGDGEDDDVEFVNETNPDNILSTSLDSDMDDLNDAWELQYFNNLLQSGEDDPDLDYVENEVEETYGSDPADADSSPDTDGDGIADGWEQYWFFDLTTADSVLRPGGVDTNADGDFDTDLEESLGGFDPLDKFSGRDTENAGAGDGLPDYWEFFYFQPEVGSNYLNIVVPNQDYEPDGATNAEELADGTNPVDGNDFWDVNFDGYYDGIQLAAGDGFGATSFNAGTNWTGAAAPLAGKSYLVAFGYTLRTPNVADQTTVFAGARLALAESQFLLKGANSIVQANYVFDGVTVRNGEDAGNPITVAGNVEVVDPSTLFADNGPIIVSAQMTGSGDLTLNGNATNIQEVRFNNATNTWTGNLTAGPNASLIVNSPGVLGTGTGSVYNIRPRATGVTNVIGGTGTINLAGTLNIDLSAVTLSEGAEWNIITSAVASRRMAERSETGSGPAATATTSSTSCWEC